MLSRTLLLSATVSAASRIFSHLVSLIHGLFGVLRAVARISRSRSLACCDQGLNPKPRAILNVSLMAAMRISCLRCQGFRELSQILARFMARSRRAAASPAVIGARLSTLANCRS